MRPHIPFDRTAAYFAYYTALLTKLPDAFVAWLRACDDPDVIGCFCERRLRPIARLERHEAKVTALQNMIHEAVEAGVDGARSAPGPYRMR